jgi:hypothetical protein
METTVAPEHIWPVDVAVKKQEQVQERRRVERTEGERLLFAGAQDGARQQGKLAEGLFASLEHSSLTRSSYALKTETGHLLARVPLVKAREMLSFRRQLARQVLGKLKVEIMKESTTKVERRQIRLQDEQIRALAWAIGEGRRFPYQGSKTKQALITLALLLCCVVPGVVYYVVGVRKPRQRYQQDLNKLVMRWRTLGKPDPPDSFFALYDL